MGGRTDNRAEGGTARGIQTLKHSSMGELGVFYLEKSERRRIKYDLYYNLVPPVLIAPSEWWCNEVVSDI